MRAGITGEVLHVLTWDALGQQIGDRRHTERMRRQPRQYIKD